MFGWLQKKSGLKHYHVIVHTNTLSFYRSQNVLQCWTVGAIFTFGRSRMFGPEKLLPLAVGRSRSRRMKNVKHTVFPRIVSAETILFWKLECGNYSREEINQGRKLLILRSFDHGNYWFPPLNNSRTLYINVQQSALQKSSKYLCKTQVLIKLSLCLVCLSKRVKEEKNTLHGYYT